MTNDRSAFQKKQFIPTPTPTHTITTPLKTPRHVRGMFSLSGIHASRSTGQRGFSWVSCVCVCFCKSTGSCLGLSENSRARGSVVVGAKMLSHVEGGGFSAFFPECSCYDWQHTDRCFPSLCACVRACVFFRCLFLVTSSVFNTSLVFSLGIYLSFHVRICLHMQAHKKLKRLHSS